MFKRSCFAFGVRSFACAAGLLVATLAFCAGARAETTAAPWSALPAITFSEPGPTGNGVLVFVGPMSTSNLGATAQFNLQYVITNPKLQNWDNSIAGMAYDRDFFGLGHGFFVGGEIGLADRYGTYEMCCGRIVRSAHILNSFEFWGGAQIRTAGLLLFDTIRVGGSLTWGLSEVTDSIGAERSRQVFTGANPELLYLLAPELQLSTPSLPNLELVIRVQHRSGCKSYTWLLPTLGNMREGYNADVFGLRYRF